jgi:lysophospholipase L1-like esterase
VALTTFGAQLEQIVEALRPQPGEARTVALLNLPDLRGIPSFARFGDDLDPRVREWNAAIAAIVASHSDYVVLVDLYGDQDGLGARADYISADAFHPSSAGYRRIATLALPALRRDDR